MIRRTYRQSTPTVASGGNAWFACLQDPRGWAMWTSSQAKAEKAHAMLCETCQPAIAAEREVMKLVRAKGLHWP